MKSIILLLSTLLVLASAFATDLTNDELEILQNDFENKEFLWGSPEEFDARNGISGKNLITNILDNVLKNILPTLTDVNIPALNLGEKVGSLADVHIFGINATEIAALEAGTTSLIVKNLTVVIGNINVVGYYNFVNITLPGPISLYGHGNFSIDLEDLILSTGITIRLISGSKLNVTALPDFYLYLNHSTLHFENLMENEAVGDLLNSIISDALPKLIEAAYAEIIEQFGTQIMSVLSSLLTCAKNHLLDVSYCFTPHSLIELGLEVPLNIPDL